MKIIYTTTGEKVKVDDEDFFELKQRNWYIKYNKDLVLVCSTIREPKKRKRMALIHREILGLTDRDKIVIHRNGDSLDNRKENLLVVDKGTQGFLRRRNHNAKLYKGVSYKKENKKFTASISKSYTKYNLGLFDTAREPAMVYDKAALELYGDLANTNKKLGLIKYAKLPKIKLTFQVHRKGHSMREKGDIARSESLRKVLKQLSRKYTYTKLGEILSYNPSTISRFIRRDRNLRSEGIDFLYSRLQDKKIQKILNKTS